MLTTICVLLFSTHLKSQETLSGVLQVSGGEKAIPYTNIGVFNKNIGTVSDSIGKFRLEVSKTFNRDTLIFSCIGFEGKSYIVADLRDSLKLNPVITLEEKIIELPEVIVSNKPFKQKVLGNKTKSKSLRGRYSNSKLGNELGVAIKIRKSPTYIKKFNTNVILNENTKMKYRLNFYSLKKGLPNKKIVNQQIIFSIKEVDGPFSLDLSQYNIIMYDDFFVSIELIDNQGEGENAVFFSANILGKPIIARETSHGTWKKHGVVGLGLNLSVEY